MQGAGGEIQYDTGAFWGRGAVHSDAVRGPGAQIITRNAWNNFAHGHVSGRGSAAAAPPKSSAFAVIEGNYAMYDNISNLIAHGACIDNNNQACFCHVSKHIANHGASAQPLEGEHEELWPPSEAQPAPPQT